MQECKVLIVDDDTINQIVLAFILENLELKVDTASSGKQALAFIQANEYAVILMDIQMPEMDGFECVSHIRKNPDRQHIPVIFVTSEGKNRKFIDQGYHLGAVDYLQKPVDGDILISKVKVFKSLFDQRMALEKSLLESQNIQRKNDQLLNFMAEGVLGLDKNNIITFANIAACTLLTSDREKVVGRPIKDFINPSASDELWEQSEFNQAFKGGLCNQHDDAVFWRNAHENFPVEYTQAAILEDSEIVGGVVAFQDISERKRDREKLINLARFDQLTQLPNRNMYWEFLSKAIASAKREKQQIAILFIDLDNFKQINDSLGHDAGDELLILVARHLKSCIREGDIVARVGGDEFAILLLNPRDIQVAATIATKILAQLYEPIHVFSNDVLARASIGIAVYPENGLSGTHLTKAADTAMYHAKSCGRNTYKYFSREMHERIQDDMKITQELHKSIHKNQLSVNYQPKIEIQNQHIVGFEALIRWLHPTMGQISPERFIPVAESSGLIKDIGDWVLLQSLEQAKQWNDCLNENNKITMSVNVSAIQFQQHHFARHIIELTHKSGLDKSLLELEITESTLMKNPEETIQQLHILRDSGIKISMDDFGTGYSSLSQLKELPIDVLKIDKSFIDEIDQSKSGNAIVSSIIDLAHSLDITVVAEGVEHENQLDFLQQKHCDIVQGYYFSKPLNKENSTSFLLQ
ncbi:MAG: EAL domain-containing protein [Pseudomonadales bacterium]|nr:EAL domain-containing protein [Pseudomonadales bacterium]